MRYIVVWQGRREEGEGMQREIETEKNEAEREGEISRKETLYRKKISTIASADNNNRDISPQIPSTAEMLIGGVDEAGRGSIIGPLVVAGLSVEQSKIPMLKDLGVRDSKQLTRQARERMYNEIINISDHHYIYTIQSTEVDSHVVQRGLNRLEARAMAHVIGKIKVDEVYVDCCDTNPERYRENISCNLSLQLQSSGVPKIYSLHHADRTNIVVSAAPILAKITRDYEIQKIRKIYRDIGSGYPSDEKTMLFIRNWVMKKKSPPEFARRSWKPLREMLEGMEQTKLECCG
jgi:ribonuclease HII